MPVATGSRQRALNLLYVEECDAWFEYLETTRGQPQARYDEIEGWAWARLQQRRRTIDTRRQKLRASR